MPTLFDLQQTIGGRLTATPGGNPADVPLGRLATDSRQVEPGEIFWALTGRRHDGAHFAAEAFRRGAIGAVVGHAIEVPEGCWALEVPDTYRALVTWAAWRRTQFNGTVIAVTGSAGKTTTRQMIHTLLQVSQRGIASPRNYNNALGVPLSMAAIEPYHQYAVLELGASRRGEIAELAALCQPQIGVITQVGDAHLGTFGSQKAIAEGKGELLAALHSDGWAVLGDDPWLRNIAAQSPAPVLWVGASPRCDVQAVDVTSQGGRLSFRVALSATSALPPLRSPGQEVHVRFCIPVWGQHHLTAALAAVAVGRLLGLELDEMAAALESFQPVPMRCEVIEARGATIINDAYNSNPTAMRAALALLRDFDSPGRRVVVCGDMAELGEQSPLLHWQLGKEIVQAGDAKLLIACGQFARHVSAGARSAGLPAAHAIPCETLEDALPYLGQAILPGDVVLVKGSRKMAMERLVEALAKYPQRRSA